MIDKPNIANKNVNNDLHNYKKFSLSIKGIDEVIGKNKNISINISDMGTAKKICTRCGRNSHNADTCYAKTRLMSQPINKFESLITNIIKDELVMRNRSLNTIDSSCFRCGRN